MKTKRASIDIGSNSCLLLAAELEDGRVMKILANESRVTGLGRGLDRNGCFSDIAMKETEEALGEYAKICSELGILPGEIVATATEASRVAGNSREFFRQIEKDLGIKVKIITGEAEAAFSAKGILLGADKKESLAIMDIGGASTEFILLDEKGSINKSFSVPIGSVRATNWLDEGIWTEKFAKVLNDWEEDLLLIKAPVLHCVAGTMTSLANMHLEHKDFVESEVHGHILLKEDIQTMAHKYRDWTAEAFLDRFPFLGKRSAAIRGGLLLASSLSKILEPEKYQVSTYGLRYGTLLEGNVKESFLA